MELMERLQRANAALTALEAVMHDLRAFTHDHVDEETGEVTPVDAAAVAVLLPSMVQRVTIALDSLRTMVVDGLSR